MRRSKILVAVPVIALASMTGCEALDRADERYPGTKEAVATTLETTGQAVTTVTTPIGGLIGVVGGAIGAGLILLGQKARDGKPKN